MDVQANGQFSRRSARAVVRSALSADYFFGDSYTQYVYIIRLNSPPKIVYYIIILLYSYNHMYTHYILGTLLFFEIE